MLYFITYNGLPIIKIRVNTMYFDKQYNVCYNQNAIEKLGVVLMKKFINIKSLSTVFLCLILALTLCACKKTESSSSDVSDTSQTAPSPSSTNTQIDNSSEDTVAPTTSSDNKIESSPKNSEVSTYKTNNTPSPSKPTTSSNIEQAKTPNQIIIGKWRGSVDMAPMFLEQGYAVEGTQMVSCDIEFTSNGVIYETIDRDSLKTAYTNVFTSVLNNSLTENNLTKEQFETSIGKTYDEYLNELVQTAMNLVPQTIISSYKFEGNNLYVRDQNDTDFEKEEYSFSGENKLTIVESGVFVTYTRIS